VTFRCRFAEEKRRQHARDAADGGATAGQVEGIHLTAPAKPQVAVVRACGTGSAAAKIGGKQHDFQTTLTHELGQALGLDESAHVASAMCGTLAPGTAIRTLPKAGLNIPHGGGGSDSHRAAVLPPADAVAENVPPADRVSRWEPPAGK
jgi:hypothetical protein